MKRLLALLFLLSSVICHPSASFATEVKEIVTPGGFKVWLVEEHALPLVAVKVAFTGSGFAYDPRGKEGRATMTAGLLMEGAGDLESRAFNEALENNAIELNFATDEDLFRASVECLSEHTEKAFFYLGLALTQPRFDDSATERVRSQTLSLLVQEESQPMYLMHRGWQKQVFGEHPYGKPVLGTKDSITAMAPADLRDYTHRYLTRGNILISVVGDITPQELSRLIDTHFAGLPAQYDPDVVVPEMKLPAKAAQIVIDHDIPQTMFIFGSQGLKRDDPNYYAAYVMNQILGGNGNLTAKLGDEIREKRGLTYSIYSQLDPMKYAAAWRGGFATRNDKAGEALDVLRATLKDFSLHGPTDKELNDAKTFLTGSFVLGLDSNADIANYLIAMQLNHLGKDYLDKRNGYIDAVRKEDVAAMARRITSPDGLQVIMVGKPKLTTGDH